MLRHQLFQTPVTALSLTSMRHCRRVRFHHDHSRSSVKKTSAQYAIRLSHRKDRTRVKRLANVMWLNASSSTSRRRHPDQVDRTLRRQLRQPSARVLLARGKAKLRVGVALRTAVGEEAARVQGITTTMLSNEWAVRGDG